MAAGVASALTTTPTLQICCLRPKSCILERNPSLLSFNATNFSKRLHLAVALPSPSQLKERKHRSSTAAKASVGSVDYAVEPETKVKFEKDLTVPGCSSPMVLVGTGFREKVFAIIGVKVYAAGFYANASLKEGLGSLKGRSLSDISEDPSVLKTILQSPAEKSLKISLVRDVDGNTFWNALNDVISPRIKRPTSEDETALSKFRTTFDGRPLKKGTIILLTWAEPSKMLVSIGSEELLPSTVDAVIESSNVTESLFDAFFGDTPVSPSLKASVADRLGTLLSSNL